MNKRWHVATCVCLMALQASVSAQRPSPTLRSPEVHADRTVTFRLRAPQATGVDGDTTRRGRESQSDWAPSKLTAPTYRAAMENNEM